ASGARCIVGSDATPSLDQPGPARARYSFPIATAGTYVIWGRIHSPDAAHNTFWIQVDAGAWHLWRITTGEEWVWDAIHADADYFHALRFDLGAGSHELLVASSVRGAELDRFYITSGAETPPGNVTMCHPPHSVKLDGGCSRSCGSQGGNECRTEFCM